MISNDIKELWENIKSGVVDINNSELFFSILLKGFVYDINKHLSVRGIPIPHYILNTGDDIMFLESKGQDHSVEPLTVSNENFVYSQVPRCMIQPSGINIPTDQLTSPYSYGTFQLEHEDMIYSFRCEFRRMPITTNISLKYYFDSFTDTLAASQQLITKLAFINTYEITYLGNVIRCSYQIPEDFQTEFMMEFDGITTDNKSRTLSLDITIESNFPIITPRTAIPGDAYIRHFIVKSTSGNDTISDGINGSGEDATGKKFSDTIITTRATEFYSYPKGGMKREASGEEVKGKDIINKAIITQE